MIPTDQEFILWSCRNGGWLTKSSLLHSDYRQAQIFDREDALDMCKLHRGVGSLGLVPVDLFLVKESLR